YSTRTDMRPLPAAPGGAAVATTDRDGRFRFQVARTARQDASEKTDQGESPERVDIVVSRLRLTAVAPGHGPAWAVVTKPEGLKDVTLRLVKDDVPIQGRVRDLEGKPIRGVTVRVLRLRVPEGEDLTAWLDLLRSRKAGHGLYRLTQLESEAVALAQ